MRRERKKYGTEQNKQNRILNNNVEFKKKRDKGKTRIKPKLSKQT